MIRIERVLKAKKLGEMARLGAYQTAVNQARADAQALRMRSQRLAASSAPGDMTLISHWQLYAEGAARAAEARAVEIALEAEAHRKELAKTIGSQSVVSDMIERHRRKVRQVCERRAEDLPANGG